MNEGLEELGLNAFGKSGLIKVVFPSTLRKVSQGAFVCCEGLEDVEINEGLEVLGADDFVDGK